MQRIDLNSDLGEGFGPWQMGDDAAMLKIVSSTNIACGGHASDPDHMVHTLRLAHANGVSIGAHPGYNDKEGFGRRVIPMEPNQIGRMVVAQIGAFTALARLADVPVSYVKAHGALANLAARDPRVAATMVEAVAAAFPKLPILAISGTEVEKCCRAKGIEVFSEIFADRGYLASGQLVPRGQRGALIEDAEVAAQRLIDFVRTGEMPVADGAPIKLNAHSICVHGDSPSAVAMARRITERLGDAGIEIARFTG